MWFFHNPGLLGINARNLKYIKAYNPAKAIMMADSKIKTKNFLSARGIPVAKIYGIIHDKKELNNFNWDNLPNTFVVKPNAGFGGEGIIIIAGRKGVNWLKSDGSVFTHKELTRHISDIIDGRYSINNLSDIAFFEQRLEAPEPFSKMSYKGLPDIRVIVHNLIPVMAMMRLPTEESQGKANVHLGGIAVGIDIAKGEMTYITQHGKEVDSIPGYGSAKGMKIPYWDEILFIASKVQQITNLGFAAVDITLDKSGPMLLEINARAGLAVQIANMAPLRRRLERIEGIKVGSPEKGVRIGRDIFGQKFGKAEEEKAPDKTVIGSLERIEVIGAKGAKKIVAQVDLNSKKSQVDSKLAEELNIKDGYCKFNIGGQRIQTVVEIADLKGNKHKIILGQRDLRDFLIDPSKSASSDKTESADHISDTPHITHHFSAEELREIDDEVVKIDQEIHLLSHLRPENLSEEYEKFIVDTSYNPQFRYAPVGFDAQNLKIRIERLEFPDSAIGQLWKKKVDEIKRKISVIGSRGTDLFTHNSIKLYGQPTKKILTEAMHLASKMPNHFPEPKKLISSKDAKIIFEKAISEYGLKGWGVKIRKEMVSDVIAGKENSVMIREGAVFTEDRIKGLIAHELETHAFTATNGSLQPYRLFQRGLADYLATEEGLAVYNQERIESEITEKHFWPASSVIGIHKALESSFSEVFAELMKIGFSFERSWKVALKAKRGMTDTSKPGAFTKDAVYFSGHKKIVSFVKNGGDLRDLYYGKINMDDLELVKKVKGLRQPVYLPAYLRGNSN